MKKNYEALTVIWRNGLRVEVGEIVRMSDAEAKYIRHAIREVKPVEAPAVEAPAVAVEAEVEIEQPVEKPSRRRHRAEAHDGDDR